MSHFIFSLHFFECAYGNECKLLPKPLNSRNFGSLTHTNFRRVMTRKVRCHDSFDHLVKTHLGFALASQVDSVPDRPGIYAWYIPLKGDDSGTLLDYVTALQATLGRYVSLSEMAAVGAQRHVLISRNYPTDEPTEADRALSNGVSNETVQLIFQLMLVMSFLAEPVYVGMTFQQGGLRARLRSHLQNPRELFEDDSGWSGSFRSRAARALGVGDGLRNCLIAYLTLPEGFPLNSPDLVRFLERQLIRYVRPAQNRRA